MAQMQGVELFSCRHRLLRGCCAVVLLLLLLGMHQGTAQTIDTVKRYQKYDPCTPTDYKPVNIGDDFVIGLAYWPGGTWDDWNRTGAADPNAPALNPCLGDVLVNVSMSFLGYTPAASNVTVPGNVTSSPGTSADLTTSGYINYRNVLSDNNVYFSTYAVKTDTMAALRTTIVEEEQLYKVAISNGQPAVVTVVAFRGNVTSPPMYIRSNDADVTSDTGIVSKLGLIISLEKGALVDNGLQWFNFDGCSSCNENETSCIKYEGQISSNQVSTQDSCAFSIDCTNCSTTVLASFQGNTVSGQPLQSSYQLTSAYQFSITSAFNDLLSGFDTSNNSF